MRENFLRYKALLLLSLFIPQPVQAQRCAADFEVILKTYPPSVAAYSIWDATHGHRDKDERFISGVVGKDGQVVVVGVRTAKNGVVPEIFLAKINRKGRVIWEQNSSVQGLVNIVKIIKSSKGGYIVLGNRLKSKNRPAVWLGLYDANGLLTGQKDIQRKPAITAYDITARRDGRGYLLAASSQNPKTPDMEFSVILTLDSAGKVISDRAYRPGTRNRILSLTSGARGEYLAAGYLYGEHGRRGGWLLKLDGDGNILWQREYPRGDGAEITHAQSYRESGIIAAGNIRPGDNGLQSGWVMALDGANGTPLWQRYYTGEMEYFSRGLITHESGLVSVLLDAKPPEAEEGEEPDDLDTVEEKSSLNEYEGQSYARLLTLDPRGIVLENQEFFSGEGLRVSQMIAGPDGARILVGYSDTTYNAAQAQAENSELEHSLDGWVAAATPVEPYEDLCIQKPRYNL